MKKSFAWMLFLLFAVIFGLPCLFLIRWPIQHFKNKEILENGIKTEAAIIKDTAKTNMGINSVPYYSIEYYFFDTNGKKHFGETSASFTNDEINELERDGFITIKYDKKTYRSIEASYSFQLSNGLELIFLIVFSSVDLVFWIILIVVMINAIKNKMVIKNGLEFTATLISFNSNTTINDHPIYYIKYYWNNASGERIEGKSKSVYTAREVILFEQAKQFKIKAIGDRSVVVTMPAELKAELYPNQPKLQDFEFECRYCGTSYNKSLKRCPKCGALKKELEIYPNSNQ